MTWLVVVPARAELPPSLLVDFVGGTSEPDRKVVEQAHTILTDNGIEQCQVILGTRPIRETARKRQLPVVQLAALALVHQQERCLRRGDGERYAIAAELRLARKLGNRRLLALVLDSCAGR